VAGFAPGLAEGLEGLAGAGEAVASAAAAAGAAGDAASAAGAALAAGATFGSAGFALGKASRSFLATGGVMVDEPALTYSPSSFSLANASLVSIPSSLAMS
jgi:hypothetical protein